MNVLFEQIIFSRHSRIKMDDRGANEEEVRKAIQDGSCEPARKGRLMMRKNFPFNNTWRGKHYSIKQVAPVIARNGSIANVITVYVYYF